MFKPELQSEFKDSLGYRVSLRKTLSQKPTKKKNIIAVKYFYAADSYRMSTKLLLSFSPFYINKHLLL